MTIRAVDHVQIAGLAASGTTDNAGTWNEDIDLDTFSAAPAGATGVVLRVVNTLSSARWAGVRTPGKTAARMLIDTNASSSCYTVICEIGAGNTIDLYCENATDVKFYIVGYTGSVWTFEDIDAAPTLATTSSVYATRTVSTAPSGAIAALIGPANVRNWKPTGAAEFASVFAAGDFCEIVKLDGSKQFDLDSSGSVSVLAYVTSGVNWQTWLGVTESITWDSTWRDAGNSFSGKSSVLVHHDAGSSAILVNGRMNGSAYNVPATAGFDGSRSFITGVDASGIWDIYAETGGSAAVYVLASFDDITTGPTITDVNTDEALSPGETATITGTGFGATQGAGGVKLTQEAGALESALTGITWGGDTSITGTVALGGLSYGATTSLVVTDNAAATGSIAVTFVPATGYSYVTLSGYPGTGYVIGEDASPAVVDGDQVEYESTASSGAGVTVNADGTFVLDTVDPGYFDYRVRDNTDNTWSSWSTIYVNIPSSATIPTTTGGTDFTSAGKMQTIFVNDSTDVPATAIMCNGFAHHADGRRYVALWPSNYDVFHTWNGIAVREDGAMIIATSGDIVESSMGIALTYRGEVRAGTATPDVIYNTVGLTSAGVLCMTAVS